jgi:rare lipoprotein A
MKKFIGAVIPFTAILSGMVWADGVSKEGNTVATGTASWYSRKDPGVKKTTANMEKFSDGKNTCAIWNLPFNTLVKVTNLLNGKSVVVRVNDRGPAKKLVREGRIIDLTRGAFSSIAEPGDGLIPIRITMAEKG